MSFTLSDLPVISENNILNYVTQKSVLFVKKNLMGVKFNSGEQNNVYED